jgi:hypothetical protein
MGDLHLDIDLLPDAHEFVIMHPFDDIELASLIEYCDGLRIEPEVIFRFPRGARLFIDGKEVGRLVDVFKETI